MKRLSRNGIALVKQFRALVLELNDKKVIGHIYRTSKVSKTHSTGYLGSPTTNRWMIDADPFRTSGYLDECVELLDTPIWKLLLFRLNGWPRLPVDCTQQKWRFWHHWYGRRD